MTNKEIMQASLLDIVFDRRNKDYGAYALRRDYPNRLMIALGTSLLLIFLIFLLGSFSARKKPGTITIPNEKIVILKTLELPHDPPKAPEIPRQLPKRTQSQAPVKFTSQVKIVNDDILKRPDMPDVEELIDKVISTISIEDPGKGGQPVTENFTPKHEGNGIINEMPVTEKETIFSHSDPEFPGGQEALGRFFNRNLNTPDELSAGEKKMVQVKFQVNKEGLVSMLEIVKSGGEVFDKEVIRVCNKMPRWKPAKQNGINVAVSFVLPVTIMAYEQ